MKINIKKPEADDAFLNFGKKILITHTHHDHIKYLDDYISLFPLVKIYISNQSSYITGQDFVIDGGWMAKGL